MAHIDDKIQVLLQRYMEGVASVSEYEELVALLRIELDSPAVEQVLLQQVETGTYHPAEEAVDWSVMLQSILQRQAGEETGARQGRSQLQGGVIRRMLWIRWVAAAVLVFLVCGLWFMVGRNGGEKPSIAVSPKVERDIAPGGDKAILTLADGRRIALDNTSGKVAKEGEVTVINLAGQLSYQVKEGKGDTATVLYNMVSVPRGGQYQLVLADGSKVWLNAASSLRFPTAFSGKERRVELTGEGYFEVAHNPSKPFIVGIPSGRNEGDMNVQVLGTHFNINGYIDEGSIKTTLLEGSVKVNTGARSVTLVPGEQAQAEGAGVSINKDVDLEQVVAWKNGVFNFHDTSLEAAMRQISRWYDVEIVYKNGIPDIKFGGKIQRNLSLSQIIKGLSDADIHFKIEEKKLIVF